MGTQPVGSKASARTLPLQFQPVLSVKEDSVWARLDSERRYIETAFREACTKLQIEAYVGRSNSFEFPANVLV
jgi:hypothetical protein